jgi:hypothetical protein
LHDDFLLCGDQRQSGEKVALDYPIEPMELANMNEPPTSAVQLIAFAAFIAAVVIIVSVSLTFISGQCTRGTPFLPTIFPCFPPGTI